MISKWLAENDTSTIMFHNLPNNNYGKMCKFDAKTGKKDNKMVYIF